MKSINKDYDLRKLQLVELDILKEFVRICNKNNYTYYISGGTYLGAVRTKSFIPWDDDIDVAMPREDYEKFIKNVHKELNKKYDFHHYKETKNYYHYFAKIVDNSVKVVNNSSKNAKTEPVWIDIFPLDGMPKNKIKLLFHKFVLLVKRALLQFSCFDDIVNLKSKNRPLIERFLIFIGTHFNIGKHLDPIKRLNSIDKSLKKYPASSSWCYVNFMGSYKFKSIIDKKVYGKGRLYDFESLKLNGPYDYDTYLTQIYGDYMNPPKENEKNKHNTELVK